MTNRQLNALRMGMSVRHVGSKYATVWDGSAALAAAYTKLTDLLFNIGEASRVQQRNIKAKRISKDASGIILIRETLVMQGILMSHAHDADLPELIEMCSLPPSELDGLPEPHLVSYADEILVQLRTYETALLIYGHTVGDTDFYEEVITSFRDSVNAPRTMTTERSAATKSLQALFAEMKAMLKNRLDRLVLKFAESHPEYVSAHRSARIIVDWGTRKTPDGDAGSDTPPPGDAPGGDAADGTAA